MKLSDYQSELKKLVSQRNGYLVVAVGSLTLCMILTLFIFMLAGRERIVLMPPSMNKDIWMSSKTASPEYYSRMTLFLTDVALNTTANNVDFQHELLLRYVDSSYYVSLKPKLIAEADRIKQQHITTAFFPADIKVDAKHSEAIITGDLKAYVGDTELPTKRVAYHIVYRFNSFSPLITLFEEVKHA